MLVQHI